MVTSTLNAISNPAAATQPGALRRAAHAVWRALEAVGEQRASMHLLSIADTYADLKPEFAQQMRLAARRHGAV